MISLMENSNFEILNKEVDAGIMGRNSGIPIGFNRLNHYIGIKKRTYFVVGGLTGSGKCLAKGTLVLMYDGTYKKVEDIKVDDLLMSLNGESTKVIGTCKGKEEMFRIDQNRGISYTVNKSHILSLKPSGKNLIKLHGDVINISVSEFLSLPKWKQKYMCGYKAEVDFDEKTLPIDPYILGLWLGDGFCAEPSICTPDKEIVSEIYKFANSIENMVSIKDEDRCPIYSIIKGVSKKTSMLNDDLVEVTQFISRNDAAEFVNRCVSNISEAIKKNIKSGGYFWKDIDDGISFKDLLKNLNLLNNKHIPFNFSRNSKKNRLELLAGIVDTDGYYTNNAGYEIVQKNEQLANDIVWLSRSLGFYTSIKPKMATMKRDDGTIYSCKVYRIGIYGDVNKIPCRVVRKQSNINHPNKDNLRTGIKVTSIGEGDYYGFELAGSKLFYLEDFTITHNTALVDDAFVLNPFDWYISDENTTNIKLKIIYRSMERSRVYKLAKWVSRKIFLDHGIIIPINKLLGWNKDNKLTSDEHDLFLTYRDYIGKMEEVITIIDNPENPIGIAEGISDYAKEHGKIERLDQYNKIYIPNDDNEITIIIVDHIGLLKLTKNLTTKKAAIDKLSDELRYARDFFGYVPVVVQQFNRDISNPIRIKSGDVEPNLDDFKESSVPQED